MRLPKRGRASRGAAAPLTRFRLGDLARRGPARLTLALALALTPLLLCLFPAPNLPAAPFLLTPQTLPVIVNIAPGPDSGPGLNPGAPGREGQFNSTENVVVPVVFTAPPPVEIPVVWRPLAEKLVDDGLDPVYVAETFYRLGDRYSSSAMGNKILELYRIRMKYGQAKEDPEEEEKEPDAAAIARGALPGISPGVLTMPNMNSARQFLSRHKDELEKVREQFGVEPEIAVAIVLVETGLGSFLGNEPAAESLAGMAACRDPEEMRPYLKGYAFNAATVAWLSKIMPQRADWAYNELKALLAYGQKHNLDVLAMPGSVYGAVGLCQFMPSNIEPYGVDATGKGWVDLFTAADALHSLANYLKEHGWKAELSAAGKHEIILHYNKSNRYANTIITVAEYLKTPPGTPLPAQAFRHVPYKYKPPRTPVKPRTPQRQGRYYGDVPLP